MINFHLALIAKTAALGTAQVALSTALPICVEKYINMPNAANGKPTWTWQTHVITLACNLVISSLLFQRSLKIRAIVANVLLSAICYRLGRGGFNIWKIIDCIQLIRAGNGEAFKNLKSLFSAIETWDLNSDGEASDDTTGLLRDAARLKDSDGLTLLDYAAGATRDKGFPKILDVLMLGDPPIINDHTVFTCALYFAVKNKDIESITCLRENDANPDARTLALEEAKDPEIKKLLGEWY
ncbi:MAG: hypothetical protein K1060chlam2_01292 [Chlamydiae bacterium]|nr:hypothetical protein [Chlamydiota bacterium]